MVEHGRLVEVPLESHSKQYIDLATGPAPANPESSNDWGSAPAASRDSYAPVVGTSAAVTFDAKNSASASNTNGGG